MIDKTLAKRYIVGIDLGTTNTVVAYAKAGTEKIMLFETLQLVSLGEVAPRPMLPSARYHPADDELSRADLELPWAATDEVGPNSVIGALALELGARVPGRLVASAKSWLSHALVDRVAPILPWGAPAEIGKVSPVAASASYLAHVRAAWNTRFSDAPLEHQEIVLTVPASFDEGARALTLEAARLAHLPHVRLIEEPQAAFYDWVFQHRDSLAKDLAEARLVLICDVGGGTTDLTLIKVDMQGGQPQLTRIGVGDHLMLGGDNMDLALTHWVENQLDTPASPQGRLSASQVAQLTQQCRTAKELLLAANAPESTSVTLLGTGAKLIGGSRSVKVTRSQVDQLITEGFFPAVAPSDVVQKMRSGIVEFGLPYASDPAITRHIAAFLRQHADASRRALGPDAPANSAVPIPDTLLLNGGVFHAAVLSQRLKSILATWRGQPLRILHNPHVDVAVAHGAVAYSIARAGIGLRIGGGSARGYFLMLDDGVQSQRGICLLPHGTEEGREIVLHDRTFALRLGRPVRFFLACSVADTGHQPGELINLSADMFVRLPPIAIVMPARDASGQRETLVQLSASLTEVGTLQVHCIGMEDQKQRWQLEFQLRGDTAAANATPELHPRFKEAIDKIDRVFGARAQQVDIKEVKQLRAQLERLLGERDQWDALLLRELFGQLLERAKRRRRSASHERQWFNLTAYCLRPGFGHALDEWRIEQLWSLYDQGVQYGSESQLWSEWWTLWRRVAGGLSAAQQQRLLDDIAPYVQGNSGKAGARSGAARGGIDDMVRLIASLERLPVECKIEFGNRLLARLAQPGENPQSWWALGRIGSRQPFYGSTHSTVPPDTATHWLKALLELDWKRIEPAPFAATQIARLTGDRSRDLPTEMRSQVVQRLEATRAAPSWIALVSEGAELNKADEHRVFGESLPQGLKLVH